MPNIGRGPGGSGNKQTSKGPGKSGQGNGRGNLKKSGSGPDGPEDGNRGKGKGLALGVSKMMGFSAPVMAKKFDDDDFDDDDARGTNIASGGRTPFSGTLQGTSLLPNQPTITRPAGIGTTSQLGLNRAINPLTGLPLIPQAGAAPLPGPAVAINPLTGLPVTPQAGAVPLPGITANINPNANFTTANILNQPGVRRDPSAIIDQNVLQSLQNGDSIGFITNLAGNVQSSFNNAAGLFLRLTG